MRLPKWTYFPAGLALLFVLAPLVGMATRVPWSKLPALVTSAEATEALWLSLRTCAISTVICVLLGVPLALFLSKQPPGSVLIRTFVLLPMALPPVVAGLALLTTFGRFGLIGKPLSKAGIEIGFTTTAVVMAQVFVSLPFLVIAVEGALRATEKRYEVAALSLGASPAQVLFRVTLPLTSAAIASGATLAFARALGEFGATLTFAGSLPGVTRTLPLAIYLIREDDSDLALALAIVLIGTALLAVLVATYLATWSQKRSHTILPISDTDLALPGAPEGAPPAEKPQADLFVAVDFPGRIQGKVTFPAGKTTVLIGANGAGKSSLIGAIMGLENPKRLELRIGEQPLSPTLPSYRRPFTLLTQDPCLFPHLSVLENVAFGLRCQKIPRDQAHQEALQQLQAVGCKEFAQRRPQQLSGGQAARVALARALATNPQVLLLDEPLAALDIQTAAKVRKTLHRRLSQAGTTTLLVTHSLRDVVYLASYVGVLADGQIKQFGSVKTVLSKPTTPFVADFVTLDPAVNLPGGNTTHELFS